ncbi:MAG: MBL fold metallo-hydrolase [Lachnospiraceae bacterium]
MEKLIMLGTGNATVTKCYNTCFALQDNEEYFLIDTGGGNGILSQLEKAKIPLQKIHHIFLSHEHTDHILGIVWMIRMAATKMKRGEYEGNLHIYCHSGLMDTVLTITQLTVQKKFFDMIGKRIFIHPLQHDERVQILDYNVQFFDICSDKAKQYGFTMQLNNGQKFTFIGDEYYRECEYPYATGSDWLLHEAFCLYRDREVFKPYEKFHATVKEACENAEMLNVKNLILYHTEDKNIKKRKELYTEEGKAYFSGNLFVPDDLEEIFLK